MDQLDENSGERLISQWSFHPSCMPRGQEYVVLSILAPEGTSQTLKTGIAIKVFGSFPTVSEANHHAQRLSKECDAFDYYVLQTCEWARLPPEVASLDDVHYQQEKLEELKNRAAGARDESAQRLRERLFAGSQAVPSTEQTLSSPLGESMSMDES